MQNGELYNPYKVFVGIFIPNYVVQDQKITLGAKLTFGILCQFSGKSGLCYPRQGVIAERLGASIRQTRRYVEELKKEKYIRVTRQGLTKANVYSFLWKKEWAESALQDRTDMSAQDRKDMSYPLILNRFILNRYPPISPFERGTTEKSSIRKRKKTKAEKQLTIGGFNPNGEKIVKEIYEEWKTKVKPKILKEQIKKKERALNGDEAEKLERTMMKFVKKKCLERGV